jgi:hypothetical protein
MRHLTYISIGLLACGCGAADSPTAPPPPLQSSIVFTTVAPASGSTVVLPAEYPYILPGGVVIPRGSGLVSVGVSITSAHEVPWAQLNAYLLTGGQSSPYCGQNDPDAPTWSFLPAGWTTTFTVTGFRVYRLPCEVTGIRVMLHMRNNGLATPPTPSETVAEATFPVSFRIDRQGAR